MGDPETYAGCVYESPPARFAPQGVEDLSAHALGGMSLKGLPLRDSHGDNRVIGKVVDDWQSGDGSKHVEFSIYDQNDTLVQREGVSNGFYKDLSLSHKLGSPPEPLEVSICHKGRRKGTAINRAMSVNEYKRKTGYIEKDIDKQNMSAPVPTATPSAPPAQATPDPTPAAPVATDSAAVETSASKDGSDAASNGVPENYMDIFRKAADSLSEPEKKVFIEGQLQKLRELEDAHQKLKDTESNTQKMEAAHRENIKQTMDTIRNFFLQGADQGPEYHQETERILAEHPEVYSRMSHIVKCAAKRINDAEVALKVYQTEEKNSAPERELYDRMRSFARDSAAPTYSYHFDAPQASSAPVSSNANVAVTAPAAPKRARDDNSSFKSGMDMIAQAMKKHKGARPSNIREGEIFR